MKLIDSNVWLALAYGGHVHHERAARWFDAQADGTCVMCRITQLALLRHLTNAKIMGTDVCSQARAWQVNDTFAADPRVIFFDEPATLEPGFRSLTQGAESGHSLWTDAYLAAFAISCGFELASLDADFQRFTGLTVDSL